MKKKKEKSKAKEPTKEERTRRIKDGIQRMHEQYANM